MKKIAGLFFSVGALAAIPLCESDALACGGCFNPPETPTVVTDHKMIFSISAQQSTLWDQIQYTGSPQSFGWVLPYSGEIDVGVSSDVLFTTIDNLTQTQILPPPVNCPAYPESCPPLPQYSAGGSPTSAEDGVNVLKREVVGPYDTAQLQASDPQALEKWLTQNGFSLPDPAKPVVAAYVGEHFNFLALKLVPGQGVQAMKPIRVTTKGANVALPLRMVAAGTGPTVGITLWIVAEGRYQPSNFNMFTIAADELGWDWTQNKSNYIDIRTQKNAAAQGRAWELENATHVDRQNLTSTVTNGGPSRFGGFGGGIPTPAPVDGGATTNTAGYTASGQKTADEVRDDDFATLFAGIPLGSEKLTRIRADLDHAGLDRDLTLTASTDQSEVSRTRQVTHELNEPQCTVYIDCKGDTTAPRSQATPRTTVGGSGGSSNPDDDGCSTTNRSSASTWAVLGLGLMGFVFARRKKKS